MAGSSRASATRGLALVAGAGVLALPARARADDPPGPRVPIVSIAVSGGIGVVSTHRTGGVTPSSTDAFLLYRTSVGLALGRRDRGLNGQLGPYLEVYVPGDLGFGGELQLDWPVRGRWRAGGRVAVGVNGKTTPFGGALIGAYLRHPSVRLGLDAIGANSSQPTDGSTSVYSYGALATAGVDGRPALIATGIAALAVGAAGAFFMLTYTAH